VAASFKDATKHPLFKGPVSAPEVKAEDILEVTEAPVEPLVASVEFTPVTEELFVTKVEHSVTPEYLEEL
jgi:hypothetical protein